MKTAGDGEISRGKNPVLITTNTQLEIARGLLEKQAGLPAQTQLEMARLPVKNIWIWLPQASRHSLKISRGVTLTNVGTQSLTNDTYLLFVETSWKKRALWNFLCRAGRWSLVVSGLLLLLGEQH